MIIKCDDISLIKYLAIKRQDKHCRVPCYYDISDPSERVHPLMVPIDAPACY